jgi:endonuclease-3
MTIRERYDAVLGRFAAEMPVAQTELRYENAYQLLVAVILSAQCTDKRINAVTPDLFRAFPTPQALAETTQDEIFEYIKSVSYPNNKAKALSGMAQRLVETFDGQVPDNLEDLTSLPGVGRKTANVILSVVWDRAAMAVDTHVFRVANRIGLTRDSKNPLQTEKTLMKYVPAELVPITHHWLILHGRYVCKARRPDCGGCFLTDLCRFYTEAKKKAIARGIPVEQVIKEAATQKSNH